MGVIVMSDMRLMATGHLLGRQERDPLRPLRDKLQQRARDVQKRKRSLPRCVFPSPFSP